MYPSTLTSFTYPTSSDKLNSPSHSALENLQSSTIGQMQAIIGTDSSIIGTIIGDLRNANSNGGGHVQTATKGGTGQTSFNKGDLLVGQSSSVLSKLAVGNNGYVLISDSSQANGVTWSASSGKLAISSSIIQQGDGTTTETSMLSVSIPGSVVGINNAIRTTLFVNEYSFVSGGLTVRANYGTTTVASIFLSNSTSVSSVKGKIEYILTGNATATSQRGNLLLNLSKDRFNVAQSSVLGVDVFTTGTSAEDSSAAKTLGITVQFNGTNAGDKFTTNGYIVEKIT